MKVIDYIRQSDKPLFSFEILPPLKGNSIYKVYDIIDKLTEFDPKFINITCLVYPSPSPRDAH
ncbi:MAG: methylenetetrahydrofolate reductase, partial [Muribaculaceae bacterium]|nr:methylenetetrahydrofolate reductase [Muribaculaceae bacterium]